MSPNTPVEHVTDQLETPLLDDREYRVIILPNKLEALLVQDPETDKASAALDVNVGAFSDDDEMPGTAHAVEHLSFMGTKKYPEENAFTAYLSTHTGYSNAYTNATSTNYYFEISVNLNNSKQPPQDDISAFYGALDRFAQFFIEPLFLLSALDRELRAVDSEYKKNLRSDTRRLDQLEKSQSNPSHPYCRFSTGNFDILKTQPEALGMDVRQKFVNFHAKHYSSNLMKLCVLGNEPLDVLETWVADLFSGVPNKNLPQNRWEEDFYENQPSWYISHLMGHEGPGGILSLLKSRGWASSLSAWTEEVCPGTPSIFNCEVCLTKKGLVMYKEVAKALFQYISLLRQTPPQEWIFNEGKQMADIKFKFRQKIPASSFTSMISSVMQTPLPRKWLLSGKNRLRKFDPTKIQAGIGLLRPDNMRMTIVSQDFPGGWNEKEKWYGTEYRYEKIPEEFLAALANELNTPSHRRLSALYLPAENPFIPTDLEIKKKEAGKPAVSPRVIRNDQFARVWWKKDDAFRVPNANIRVGIKSRIVSASANNLVKSQLFTDLVVDTLDEYSYNAQVAGLRYSIALDSRGLLVAVSGYTDKLALLLKQVFVTIRDLTVEDERFAIVKENLTQKYENFEFQPPFTQVGDYVAWLASQDGFVPEQLMTELPSITAQDIRTFHSQIMAQLHIETYVHGNLHKGDASELTDMIQSILNPRILPTEEWPILRSLDLPPGSNFVYQKTLKDLANINNCVMYYLHIGNRADRNIRVKTQLFEQMIHEPAFHQLRTKEQLGYIVSSGLQDFATMHGFYFVIQSQMGSEYLVSRIDAFLRAQAAALGGMTNTAFERHKGSLINKQLEKLQNLDQETQKHWAEISNEYYDFDAAQRDAELVRILTQPMMIEFYTNYVDPTSLTRAKLVVQLIAQGVSTKLKDIKLANHGPAPVSDGTSPTLITSVRDYKAALAVSAGARPVRNLGDFL
ncbi:peptidase M16 inactive domain-containing protein [Xylaria sp. FL0064]|nr:peptidase M16 inactive domain-containing protein [Xylaria sp. FL0064]